MWNCNQDLGIIWIWTRDQLQIFSYMYCVWVSKKTKFKPNKNCQKKTGKREKNYTCKISNEMKDIF